MCSTLQEAFTTIYILTLNFQVEKIRQSAFTVSGRQDSHQDVPNDGELPTCGIPLGFFYMGPSKDQDFHNIFFEGNRNSEQSDMP